MIDCIQSIWYNRGGVKTTIVISLDVLLLPPGDVLSGQDPAFAKRVYVII